MRRVDLAELVGALVILATAAGLGVLVFTFARLDATDQSAPLECVTEEHYFPETNTSWYRLTCNDGSVHWEMR